ncbi:MAG: hypothetical protein MZV70_41245 [Desulfobacterales bacterium]|nr:hypothetical protein [Desulfobacterales bacterium]
MPGFLQVSPGTRAASSVPPRFASLRNLSGNGTSGKIFARLRRLGIIAGGLTIFVSFSWSAARAQMNQPGLQLPSGPTARFDHARKAC